MPKMEQTVLVLQGGGALGAYQAGASQVLAEGGFPESVFAQPGFHPNALM